MSSVTIDEFMNSAEVLPGELRSFADKDAFFSEFKEIFSTLEAKENSKAIYAFTCRDEIPRVNGRSPIAYIGQTKNSLFARYGSLAGTFCNEDNWPFYSCVIEKYGPIQIKFITVAEESDLKAVESALLTNYFLSHLDYPPKNSSRG